MNLLKTQQQSARTLGASSTAKTRLSGVVLVIARVVWLLLIIPSLGLTVVSFPVYYQHLQRTCEDATTCSIAGAMTTKGLQAFASLGVSASEYAAFYTSFWAVIFIIWCGIGLLIFWRGSDDGMALLTAFFLVLFNTGPTTSALPISYPALTFPVVLMGLLGQVSLWLFFLLFPSGRLVPRWMGLLIPLAIMQAILYVAPSTSLLSVNAWPGWFNGLLALLTDGGIIVSQVYRYRRTSTAIEHQQTKWVAFAITTVVTGFFVFGILFSVFFSVVNQPDSLYSLFQMAYPLLLLVLPVCIGIAILRYRLWDIDLIINRSLVYGILTACVLGIYVLVVGYLGALFHTGSNLAISLLATGLVAVFFQPLKGLLQRGVNRLFYGQRDEPYRVISRLGQRLEATLAPDATFSVIVETVAQALKLPYVAISLKSIATTNSTLARESESQGNPLKQDGEFLLVASYISEKREVSANEALLHLPLLYQREQVGELVLATRSRGESFTPADLRLLDDLARQVGVAAHAVQLTAALQQSRERLVTAREEERRRLRRDLHDGLGPTLAALTLQAGVVRRLIPQDPTQATAQVTEWRTTLRSVIADIRRLVYDLRPPALDELGLVGAIREQATQYSTQAGTTGVHMVIEAPDRLPPLSAAVEVATYRIALEALTNVARHAQARTCHVRLWLDDALHLEITDDGIGLSEEHRAGVGMLSMRERAEELGGSCTIEPALPLGSRVSTRLPFPKEERDGSAPYPHRR